MNHAAVAARVLDFRAPLFRMSSGVDAREASSGVRSDATAWRALSAAAQVYVGAAAVLGGLTIAYSMSRITERDASIFAALAMLSLITSFAKVNLPAPQSGSTLTVCYVIDFTTLLLLGRPAATLTAAIGAWSQCTFRCRREDPPYQMWFSVGALALTVQATGAMHSWMVGQPDLPHLPQAATYIGALAASATVFFLVNSFLVAGAVGLSTGQSPVRVWRTSYLWIWPGHVFGLGLAALAAEGIGRSNLWLLPFAVASLAVTYGTFKGCVSRLSDSVTDALTDLPNRRYLVNHVAQELARSERDRAPLALILIDLDGFKAINDTYGHRAGDFALREVAGSLQRSVRSYDICARYGGDEFVVVLPGCDFEHAGAKMAALQTAVAALRCEPKSGVTAPLRISAGLAMYPSDGETLDQLVAAADARMFEDKGASRESHGTLTRATQHAAAPAQSAENRQLPSDLLHAQRLAAIGQMTSSIAHDFNNALTAILGYGELLTEQIGPDKSVGRDLQEIVGAARHAATLTSQLLAFSRKRDVAVAAVDLNDCIRTAEAMLRRLLAEPVAIRTTLTTDLCSVFADVTQIEQVLVNLAVNARDAMPNGGTLHIETQNVQIDAAYASTCPHAKPGPYAVLSVSDTGRGMTPDVKARIFEPFFTTKGSAGTGLGLAAIWSIVATLGGWIEVDSQRGRGTAFRIYVPKAAAKPQRPAIAAPGVGEAVSVGTETILLVEDEEGVRSFATRALTRHGYHVLAVPTAEAALKLLQQQDAPVHLLLTDVVLPGIDGHQLAARVERSHPDTQVLFTTGYADRARRHADGRSPTASHLIEKPFTARELLARTRQMLDRVH